MVKPIPPKATPELTIYCFIVFLSGFPGAKNNKYQVIFITGRSDDSQNASTNEMSTLMILRIPPHRLVFPNVEWALSLVLCAVASPERYALPKGDEHNA
ncbi:hypothetical protein AAH178_004487 [Serratia marcescens]